jgi:hypothetical protein
LGLHLGGGRRLGGDLLRGRVGRRGGLALGVLRLLDDAYGAVYDRVFLGEVFVTNLLGQFFRDGVGRDAHVHALAAHLFDEALRLHLQLFGQIVYAYLGRVGC